MKWVGNKILLLFYVFVERENVLVSCYENCRLQLGVIIGIKFEKDKLGISVVVTPMVKCVKYQHDLTLT